MKYKSETQNVLKPLFSLVYTQYDTRIRKIQIDGAFPAEVTTTIPFLNAVLAARDVTGVWPS